MKEALAQEGATKCSALRAVAAAAGNTPRALFIKAASIVGINSGTAARQWQEGRADETPKAASEDTIQLIKDWLYDSGLAMDEVVEKLLPLISKQGIAALVKEAKEIAALGE